MDGDLPPPGVSRNADGSITWRVWAPFAEHVDLMVGASADQKLARMKPLERGWHTLTSSEAPADGRYAYRLNRQRTLPDPATRWQPDGLHKASALFFPEDHIWTDAHWRGIPREELVIYEVHVGTFTREGTFAAIIPRLKSLRELGVTAIEIMPVAQFPGARGWGYDGVHPFATQHSYGGPAELQRLIDACHREGLAAILDVVYNHLGPEGNYLGAFGPYFTDKYRTPWGPSLNYDDRGSDMVRQFVLENVRYWLRDFHFDGLRLDAIHAIVDESPKHLLREIQEVAEEESGHSGRPLHIIAESNLNNVRILESPEAGGYGIGSQWSDDFHHCVHTLLTKETKGYYADYGRPDQLVKTLNDTFVYDGIFSQFRDKRFGAPIKGQSGDRFIINIQTHDQVGNRALGDRLATLVSPAELRLAAAVMLLAPHLPLLWMGEEYGETTPFAFFCSFGDAGMIEAVRRGRRAEFADWGWPDRIPDPQAESTFNDAKITWNWPEGSWQAGLRRWYQDLLHIRAEMPALRDFQHRRAVWHAVGDDPQQGILELSRGAGTPEQPRTALAYFNFSASEKPLPPHVLSHASEQCLLSSELSIYGGSRPANATSAQCAGQPLLPYESRLYEINDTSWSTTTPSAT